MNTDEKLVYMANQIASNFAAQRSDDPTVQAADHIARFWDPGMKQRIFARLDAGNSGLNPVAEAAVKSLRAVLQP